MKLKQIVSISIILLLFQSCGSFHEQEEANQQLHDIWMVTSINEKPLNKMVSIPRLEINLTEMKIFGNDGCNDFTGTIKTATKTALAFNTIASTKKMCLKAGVEAEFYKAMNTVKGYSLKGLRLTFTDTDGNEILSFLKVD